jgi:hypothetical protein
MGDTVSNVFRQLLAQHGGLDGPFREDIAELGPTKRCL